MPIYRPQFVNGEFYHVLNRGVEQRSIFLDDEDYLRFLNSVLVFNDKNPTPWNLRGFWNTNNSSSLIENYKPQDPLVEIHAFTLMGNHFHFLLKQIRNNGISDFMRKIGGYAYYFNKKYQRIGSLFQGRFKAVLIKNEKQLKNIFVYIHANAVEIIEPKWKEFKVENPNKAISFVKEYKWSSCRDYLAERKNSNLLTSDFFLKLFENKENCEKEIKSWIDFKGSQENLEFKNITLE